MTTNRKTYSHLAHEGGIPSEYDIVSKKLHYYPRQGIESKLKIKDWYDQYQQPTLSPELWDTFSDPAKLTYSGFVDWQKEKENSIDSILSAVATNLNVELIVPPARYLFHGLQMISAYIGSMAPSSQLTIVALMQAQQEMSRLQRFAYYMRFRQVKDTNFGLNARQVWEDHSAWQPLRKNLELLLVTYDWIDAFIGMNVVLKPKLDKFFNEQLANFALINEDPGFAQFCQAFQVDSQWQQNWTSEFLKLLNTSYPDFDARFNSSREKWLEFSTPAVSSLSALLV